MKFPINFQSESLCVGTAYQVKARKEVILSGGSIGTAQILLLSGIGPEKDLERLGIQSVVNLPDVGMLSPISSM